MNLNCTFHLVIDLLKMIFLYFKETITFNTYIVYLFARYKSYYSHIYKYILDLLLNILFRFK